MEVRGWCGARRRKESAMNKGIESRAAVLFAAVLLLAVFMRWLGGYRWDLVILIAVGVPAVFYLMFELWFLVPLPKGPIEDLLGL